MTKLKKFSPEFRERAVHMVQEHRGEGQAELVLRLDTLELGVWKVFFYLR